MSFQVRRDEGDVAVRSPLLSRADEEGEDDEEGEEVLPAFLQDIVDVLSVLRFGSNDFLRYVQSADIRDAFDKGQRFFFAKLRFPQFCTCFFKKN